MYYESYHKKPKRRRRRRERRGFGQWLASALLKLVAIALVLVILCAAVLYAVPPALFAVEPEDRELYLTDGLPSECINVLLLGADVLYQSSQRTDTIIIATVGYGKLRLTSVLRDTIVEIPGHGQGKLNAAFAYGGPELAIQTLNKNFHLNIIHYACVDFVSLVRVVDAIGGIEMDITEAEREQINLNVIDSRHVFAPLGYVPNELTQSGEATHLDGLQALGFARIRKLDSDYMRASRQRRVLNAILVKMRANLWNPVMWVRLAKAIFETMDTNMSLVQLVSLGEKALAAGRADQMRMPVDGSFTDDGSKLTVTDFNANTQAFIEFAYAP